MWWLVFATVTLASTGVAVQVVARDEAPVSGFGEVATREIVDFDTYPDGSPVPEGYTVHDQWSSLGVVFTMGDSSRAVYAVPHMCSLSSPNHVGGDPAVLAWFVDPLTGAPAVTDFVGTAQDNCWGPGEGILMQAFDIHGELLAEAWNEGSGNLVTFSFPEPVVAMIRMREVLQGIDNFTFNIPVPAGTVDAPGVPVAGGAALRQNYPNPFNPRTTVSFTLPAAGHALVTIHDAKGRLVARLVDQPLPAGAHTADWDGQDAFGVPMPSGTYFCRLTTPWGVETRKMSMLR
ncbi:MAG: T9SS type A sorting domain-containing protein [bacterium]|nr:T9SS type A sorting domain-containing protein [bacterium]